MTKVSETNDVQNIDSSKLSTSLDKDFLDYPKDAEKANGRWAMIGFLALIGAYITTGQIIPGIF